MRSGRIEIEDRIVWVGDSEVAPIGSSFKARDVTRTHVAVDPINGTHEQRLHEIEWHRRGTEIVSCIEAAKRGIEPWSLIWDENGKVRPRPKRGGGMVSIFLP